MELKDHILQIRGGLKSGSFINEASVSQGVVLRLLQALGWPIFDSKIVCPEYTLEGRRVDFALCHSPERPVVLIEVKKIGQTAGADRQVFEYAFHAGVPMAILTDGQEWHFYLPGEQGNYQERRVYTLDVVEREVDESESRLKRYLAYVAWSSGTALDAAKQDYRDVARKRQIESMLPQAWAKIIEEQDDILMELITDKVESLCGYRPDLDTVASFLSSSSSNTPILSGASPGIPRTQPQALPSDRPAGPPGTQAPTRVGFRLNGIDFPARTAQEILIKLFEELATRDKTFLERFAARPRHGRFRRYVAREKLDLYPNRPDLCDEFSHQLKSGWWLGTNYSRKGITKIIKIAAEVAGLAFGRDLLVNVG